MESPRSTPRSPRAQQNIPLEPVLNIDFLAERQQLCGPTEARSCRHCPPAPWPSTAQSPHGGRITPGALWQLLGWGPWRLLLILGPTSLEQVPGTSSCPGLRTQEPETHPSESGRTGTFSKSLGVGGSLQGQISG